MSRSKDRPILFEVVSRENAANLIQSAKLRPTATPRVERPKRPAARPIEPTQSETADPIPREPPVQFRSGRLRINVGWIGLSAAATGLLLVLLVTFQAGGRYAGGIIGSATAPDDELSRLLAQTADPSVLDTQGSHLTSGSRRIATPPLALQKSPPRKAGDRPRGKASPPVNSGTFAREKGKHYIIVQHFRKSESKAAAAAALFLTSRGVPSSIDRSGSDIRLFAHESFLIGQKDANAARRDQQRCETLKARIKTLGKEYVKKAGYAFEGCRERKY